MISDTFKPKRRFLLGTLVPALFFYALIIILPLIFALVVSFTNWKTGGIMNFIGVRNYINLLKTLDFWAALKNNAFIIAITMLFQITISFLLAIVISSKTIRFKRLHTNFIFMPVVVSPVIIAILWWLIYDGNTGMLNMILRSLHLESLIKPWLSHPKYALGSVSVAIVWQYIGIYLMIFLSSIQGISKDVYEAAEVDGAVGFKKTIYITVPLLLDTFKVVLVLCISGGMKIFEHIYVMTGGGPAKSTMVLAQYAYNNSFKYFKLGYGSTVSIMMIIISLSIVVISNRVLNDFTKES